MEEKVMKAIQDDYPDEFAWCYGCGRLNEMVTIFEQGGLVKKR